MPCSNVSFLAEICTDSGYFPFSSSSSFFFSCKISEQHVKSRYTKRYQKWNAIEWSPLGTLFSLQKWTCLKNKSYIGTKIFSFLQRSNEEWVILLGYTLYVYSEFFNVILHNIWFPSQTLVSNKYKFSTF